MITKISHATLGLGVGLLYASLGLIIGIVIAYMGLLPSASKPSAIYGIPGEYVPVTNLRPSSLDTVRLDIYSDFTCPHCQTLDTQGIAELKQLYGDRVDVRTHYMATNTATVAPMILYLVGERAGRAAEVSSALMGATLKRKPDAANLPAVRAVAKQLNLQSEFDAAYASEGAREAAVAQFKDIGHQIAFFPFVMVEGQIGTTGSIKNLQSIIDSLLTEASKETAGVPTQTALQASVIPSTGVM